jgi:hypothetical protein
MHVALPRTRAIVHFWVLGLVATLVVACQADTDVLRFAQTWEVPLDETSCQQWTEDMTGAQRYAAAAELLLEARGDETGFPSDGQFAYFLSRIDVACAGAPEALVSDRASSTFAEFEARLTSGE